jgi:hypothetical protein
MMRLQPRVLNAQRPGRAGAKPTIGSIPFKLAATGSRDGLPYLAAAYLLERKLVTSQSCIT